MSNIDISWLLPHKSEDVSLRKDVCSKAIKSMQETMEGEPYNYEIVVVSKDKVEGDNVVWVEEPKDNDGAVLGFNMAYHNAKGKYVGTLIDDCVYNKTFLKGVEFLESDAFKDRKYKITSLSPELGFDFLNTAMPIFGSLSSPAGSPQFTYCNRPVGPAFPVALPPELCLPRFHEAKYRYPVFGYVFAERENIKKYLGDNIANPRFKHRYWDNWISFYIGEMGEFPLMCDGTYSVRSNTEYSSYHNNDFYDLNIFLDLATKIIRKESLEY
jgi:hypothetical protein